MQFIGYTNQLSRSLCVFWAHIYEPDFSLTNMFYLAKHIYKKDQKEKLYAIKLQVKLLLIYLSHPYVLHQMGCSVHYFWK